MRREIFLSGEITDLEKRGVKKCASFSLDEKGASFCVKEGKEMLWMEAGEMKRGTLRGVAKSEGWRGGDPSWYRKRAEERMSSIY